jgi:replicative DNA helicase
MTRQSGDFMTDVSNRSGGADFHAEEVRVGQDVVGRDKIISTTINNYFANIDPSRVTSDNEVPPTFDSDDGNRGHLEFVGDLVRDYLTHLEQIFENQGEPFGIPTGFLDLDRLMGGLQRSDLIIVAARASLGKTSFILNIALNIALRFYQRAAIFSLTATNRQILQRLLSALSGINSQRLRLGDLAEDEWDRFAKASNDLSEASICIDDTPSLSISLLRDRALRIHAERGLDAIFVDGLQLLTCESPHGIREQEKSGILRALKALAREANVPVIVTSELGQSVDRRIDRRPRLSDFDEQMFIERYADAVLFIYRDDLYDSESMRKNIAEIIVAKHQQGPTGTVELFFQSDLGLFRNALKRDIAPHD